MNARYHHLGDLPATLPVFPLTGILLLPRGALPLNIFEPRYLALIDAALAGNRLIGVIQPTEDEDTTLKPKLSRTGCAGRIVSYRETDDNRYLITLEGICRFHVVSERGVETPFRQVEADFSPYATDLIGTDEETGFPRERLLDALKSYLNHREMKADWHSVVSAPAEALVNALAMMCPFEPAEKQALLEAPGWIERVSTLVALLEMAGPDLGAPTIN